MTNDAAEVKTVNAVLPKIVENDFLFLFLINSKFRKIYLLLYNAGRRCILFAAYIRPTGIVLRQFADMQYPDLYLKYSGLLHFMKPLWFYAISARCKAENERFYLWKAFVFNIKL